MNVNKQKNKKTVVVDQYFVVHAVYIYFVVQAIVIIAVNALPNLAN